MVVWRDLCSGARYLRPKCLIIGYLSLFSSVVDLCCHLVVLSIVTNFFACDVNLTSLHSINWPWLEAFLIIINIGTHGFYPFPLVLTYYDSSPRGVPSTPKCYPGMVHLYIIDLMNILIHAVWLRVVLSYVTAVHKKDPEPMRMFFSLSVVKITLQVLYFANKPFFYSEILFQTYWFIKIIDFCVAIFFLLIMDSYIKVLRAEKSAPAPVQTDQPPSYVECLVHTQIDVKDNPPQIVVANDAKMF